MSTDIWKPNVTVAAVVERNNKFLVVEERSGGSIVFNQPAGHLEDAESLIEAVIRETLEETAWHFTPEAVTGIYRYSSPGSHITYIRICFCGSCSHFDNERSLDDGIIAAHWLSRDELESRSGQLRSPLVLRCIDDYLASKRYPLDILADIE